MQTIPCPGCRTDLDPAATVCPICLRPRTKLEITRAFATLREMEKQRKRRPFVITGRILAAAAIGAVFFRFHGPILGALSTAAAFGSKTVNDFLYPPSAQPPAASPPPAAAQTSAAPAPGSSAPSSFPHAAPGAPARAETPPASEAPSPAKALKRPAHVEDLPLPQFDSAAQWVFYGRVYNLATLLPVSDARLSFPAVGNNAPVYFGPVPASGIVAASDSDGRFSVVLSRLAEGQSYEIHSTGGGYASSVLYEPDIPYAKLPLSERQEIVRNAQDGDMTLPPLTDGGEASVRRDVFLAPAR